MKVTIELIENTKESRAELVPGYGYLVEFHDIDTGSSAYAGALWNGFEFKYFDGRFMTGCEPRLTTSPKVLAYNRVTGFIRFVDMVA